MRSCAPLSALLPNLPVTPSVSPLSLRQEGVTVPRTAAIFTQTSLCPITPTTAPAADADPDSGHKRPVPTPPTFLLHSGTAKQNQPGYSTQGCHGYGFYPDREATCDSDRDLKSFVLFIYDVFYFVAQALIMGRPITSPRRNLRSHPSAPTVPTLAPPPSVQETKRTGDRHGESPPPSHHSPGEEQAVKDHAGCTMVRTHQPARYSDF